MPIEATVYKERILVQNIPFRMKDIAKGIHGSKAEYTLPHGGKFIGWSYPLTMDACHMLRRTFGREMLTHKSLNDWYRNAQAAAEAVEAIRTGEVADMTRVRELAPEMYMAMQARPYQSTGASFLAMGQHVGLGDDPGLGKTVQTLAALIQKGATRILVACPQTTTRSVWMRETNRWAPTIMPFVAQGTHSQREQQIEAFETYPYLGPKMLIINTEMIRAKKHWDCPNGTRWDIEPGTIYKRRPHPKTCHDLHGYETIAKAHKKVAIYTWPQLFKRPWDAIIMDESHQFLASTYNVMSKHITQGRLGAMHLRRMLTPDGMASALSGTPFRSDLRKAWGTLNWLQPKVFTSFHQWAQSEFDQEEDDGSGWGQAPYKREPRDPEGFNARLRPYFLARSKADVAPDLPPIQYMGTRPTENEEDGLQAIWLPLTEEQRKAYEQMAEDAQAEVKGGTLSAVGVLAEITRKRQLASVCLQKSGRTVIPSLPSNKYDWVLEFLREHQGHDTKVVIASEFTQVCELFAQNINADLGEEVLQISGNVTGKARDLAVQRFQDTNDPCKIMVLNMQAGGVGITLDTADYMILLDVPWTSDVEEQVVNRIHRVSRVHNVFVYRVLSEDTIDEWMAILTEEQRRILRSAGPKAIEMARKGLAA